MAFDAYIFDLDGTLLDTLPDLVNLTNTVLSEWSMPTHTSDEVKSYVGNGARMLMRRATVAGTSEEVLDAVMDRWKQLYPELGHKNTRPYEGMPEMLAQIKERGAKLGVLSNKPDEAARGVIAWQFPNMFDLVRGEGPETPRKPDPMGLNNMMRDLEVDPSRCAYIGDSGVDMAVATAAGAFAVGATWGYRGSDELLQNGARVLLADPADVLHVC